MKIVFITPTTKLKRFPVYRAAGKIYGQPNSITGPLILGGILKKAGHEVEVYEELNGPMKLDKVLPGTDVFCFSIMASNAPRAYELADEIHEKSSARVLMGGIHATAVPEEAAQHADQVLTGEGEKIILDVVEGRVTDQIVRCEPIEDLDEVPYPDYSILKTPVMSANVLTTRGCPYRCTFCTTSRMFDPYRQRSVDNVIEEIRMYKKMGFKYMNFEDDNFTADKERAKEICRRMIAEGLTFKETFFFGRTDLANDEELLDLLREAHLTRVLIGIESLNQKALNSIDKGQNIDDIKKAGKACADHGIRVIASIVLGLDDDTREDIRRSVDFAKSINAYQLQPAVLTPYPGTPVFHQMEYEGRLIDKNWEKYDMMNVTFQPKNLSPWELQEEFYHAVKHFYDFKSVKKIRELFGKEYGRRRLGLAIFCRIGSFGAHMASHVKGTIYNQIRNTKWIYGPENASASGSEGEYREEESAASRKAV
ncbi:MAG: B12-binding domain-containing radical SAM protein [Anaerovoracaceae bacterium]|jgi:radical SAM superfamily enzyme YgiQ (UPF0313 family)